MLTRVYRNLQNGQFSIQQKVDKKWAVVGYSTAITLENVTVRQSVSGRDRARRDQQRNVHCMVEGMLTSVEAFTPLKGRPVITGIATNHFDAETVVTYNPFKHSTLVYQDNESEFVSAARATFIGTVMRVAD